MFPATHLQPVLAGRIGDAHHRKHIPLYCGIQYNHSGRLKLKIGDAPYELHGAWVFLTHPWKVFEYEFFGDEPHFARYVCMDPESVKPYIQSGMFPLGSPPIKINDPARFSHCMNEAVELIRTRNPERFARAIWHVEDLLLQLQEQSLFKQENSWLKQRLDKLTSEIQLHPERTYDFNRIAGQLSITPRHFRRVFKEHCGSSPTNYQILCRLDNALRLLADTTDSIALVAQKVGIDNPYYFSNLFKQHFKISPTAYRKEFHH